MHPVLFRINDFVIGTYGALIVIGIFFGMLVIARLARSRGVATDFFFDLLFVVIVSGFLGARLTFILQNFGQFLREPLAMLFSRQGFVFQGGLIAAVIGAIVLVRRRGLHPVEIADIIAPGLVLGHAFGRVGCFLAGCCHGDVCLPGGGSPFEPIAVRYPAVLDSSGRLDPMFNFAYFGQVERGLLQPGAPETLPMVPVQLLETAGNVAICLLLLLLWRRRRFSGQIAGAYLLLYSVLRYVLEFWRGDLERGVWPLFGNLTISNGQIISLVTLAAGIALLLWRRGRGILPAYLQAPATAEKNDPAGTTKQHTDPPSRAAGRRSGSADR